MKKRIDDKISAETKRIIYKKKTRLRNKVPARRKVYNREIFRTSGFDFLEYYGAIRRFLMWKYKLDCDDLELLYYLYPRTYFTKKDYKNYPMRWGQERFGQLVKEGFFIPVFPEQKAKKVYTLSHSAKLIVVNAHKMLTGEKKMPIDSDYNVAFTQAATPAQKRYKKIMKEMKEQLKIKQTNSD